MDRPLRSVAVAAVLLTLLALCGHAAAQGVRVLEEDVAADVRPGELATLTWTLAATDGQDHFVLADIAVEGSQWTATVDPPFTNVPAGGIANFTATLRPGQDPDPRTATVTLTVEDASQNATLVATGIVTARGFGQILGIWENPLPAPLDGPQGAFLLNILAWMGVAAVAMLLVSPALRLVTSRTRTDIDDQVVRILARPAFYLVFLYGIRASAANLRMPAWAFAALDAVWLVLSVVILALAAYRLWHEVVVGVGRSAAGRTSSELDDRLLPVIEKLGGIVIIIVAVFHVFDSFGINMAWLAAGGAIGGLVIAFAAQDTLGNFFAGIHLLIDQPFAEGDDIILDTGEVCTVRHVGLRSTQLYHVANHELIIVPNSLLANHRIVNIMRPDSMYKVKVEVGVAYGTDVQKVKGILLDLARRHPLSLSDKDHQPFVRFNAFGASSLDFAVHAWVGDVYARYAVASDLREMVEQRFAEEGIEIPFPQRVMWNGREEADRDEAPRPPKQLELHGG